LSKNLAHYLQQLALEGDKESQGSFTVDYSKALEKLSTRLFSDRASYLLKLVQAAFQSGAHQVDVRTHRDRLEVHFTSKAFSSEQMGGLRELLLQPLDSKQEPGLSHFLRAIQAARAGGARSLGWAVRDQQGGVGHLLQGDDLQTHSLPARAGAGSECVFSLRMGASGKGAAWVEEQQALSARCRLSPRPIRWDNRGLNPVVPRLTSTCLLDRIFLSQEPCGKLLALPHLTELKSMVYDLGNGYKDHYSYGETLLHQWRCYRPGNGHNLFQPASSPDYPMLESDFIQEFFGLPKGTYAVNHGLIRPGRLEGSNNGYQILYIHEPERYTQTPFLVSQGRFGKNYAFCAQAWMRCPAQPLGPSQVYLLQDGVLLDPVEVELGLSGMQIFVADDQAQTDLSGLTPVQDERFQQMVNWLQEEAGKSKRELRKALRWSDKYGYTQAWVDYVYRMHNLDRDD
jgi:hypothetical protein